MALPSLGRRSRIAPAVLLLALFGSLIPVSNVLATVVNPASGGGAISADEFATSDFTTLTGPAIAEAAAGELVLGSTTILNIPTGFRFNPGSGNVSIGGGACDLSGTLTVTASQATFTVTHASTASGCIATFVGLQVQPTAGPGFASGNITKTGTSTAPGGVTNYGTLTKVAGAITELIYLTQPSASNSGGVAFVTQPRILARDQFGTTAANAPITLSITPGTGASGAILTCTTNPLDTDGGGVADFSGAGCRIDLAGSYKVRATNGSVSSDSGTFNVNVGPATKIVFRSYPGSTTPSVLTPQPRVAITDAGGNTVTTFPATAITLAINKNAASFTCTGGLTSTTVNGEAAWTGCAQTTEDAGYQLTATVGFANATGVNFAVAAPIPTTSISLTTFCGTPTPVSTGGSNQCPSDASKTPAQTNIKLPQNLTEGVWLRANLPTNGANRAVTFEFSKDLVTWSTIQPATTDASGNASVFYRPSDNRYYRVTFAGAGDLGPATSPTIRVVVRALVFLRPTSCTSSSPCRVHQKAKVLFTVTARPNRAELPTQSAQYLVERKSGSTWVTVVSSVVSISKSSGTATFSVTFNAKGTWRLRVNLQPTSVNANSFPTGYEYYSVS